MKRDIYTRPHLARRIVSRLGIGKDKRVIDLGCGAGVFIQAVIDHVGKQDDVPPLDGLAPCITGVEIDPVLVQKAVSKLNKRFGTPLGGWNIQCGDALYIEEDDKYDFVVGNPPWVRLHDLDAATKALAHSEFEVAKGAFNLYHLFIEKAIRLLKPDGQFALIVPQTLEVGPASAHMRKILSREGSWSLTSLPDNSFAPRAEIRPALLVFQKELNVRLQQISTELASITLGSFAYITSGVATGADKLFIMNDQPERDWNIESHRLKPIIRGRDVVRVMREEQAASHARGCRQGRKSSRFT